MQLQDNFTKGFWAGVSGGILMNLWSYVSYLLNIAELRFLDWPSIIITGQTPNNILEYVFALIVQLIFVGFLGVIFAYLLSRLMNDTNYLFKGFLFGVIMWFAIYAFTFLANVPKLTPLDIGTAVTDFTGAIIFGVIMAKTLSRLDYREKLL